MRPDYSSRNKFVSQTHDRLSLRRRDKTLLTGLTRGGKGLVLPVWRHKVPASDAGELLFSAPGELSAEALATAILLGEWQGQPCFAVDMGSDDAPPRVFKDTPFQNLRSIGALSPEDSAALAAYALAMVYWHRRHRFCGRCGGPNVVAQSGHVLNCSNPDCDTQQFPRSDPAIIVLVTHDGKALLGRKGDWPAGVYSTIAGFVEPGESLENAVRREVAEETGVGVDAVRYHSSQPWPFPASLMLGFHATASSYETRLMDDELEDVRWFSRDDIVEQLSAGALALSARISIAYRLIEHWFDDGKPGALADLIATRR